MHFLSIVNSFVRNISLLAYLLINMYVKGGFNLPKFTSNKKEVLVKISEEKKKKGS